VRAAVAGDRSRTDDVPLARRAAAHGARPCARRGQRSGGRGRQIQLRTRLGGRALPTQVADRRTAASTGGDQRPVPDLTGVDPQAVARRPGDEAGREPVACEAHMPLRRDPGLLDRRCGWGPAPGRRNASVSRWRRRSSNTSSGRSVRADLAKGPELPPTRRPRSCSVTRATPAHTPAQPGSA